MKKILYLITFCALFSCDSETYNDVGADIIENTPDKVIGSKTLLGTTQSTDIINLPFTSLALNDGIDDGGCEYQRVIAIGDGAEIRTFRNAFGPKPINKYGFNIRGYGAVRYPLVMERKQGDGLVFEAYNKPGEIWSPRQNQFFKRDDPQSNAISIEYPFEGNFTYEVRMEIFLVDKLVRNNSSSPLTPFSVRQSQGSAHLFAYLDNNPEFPASSCKGNTKLTFLIRSDIKHVYYKERIFNNSDNQKPFELVFNFSPLEARSALKIGLIVDSSENQQLKTLESYYYMNFKSLKVTKKTFNPRYNYKIGDLIQPGTGVYFP